MSQQDNGLIFCSECGTAVTGNDIFCINCGHQVRSSEAPPAGSPFTAQKTKRNPLENFNPKKIVEDGIAALVSSFLGAVNGVKSLKKRVFVWLKERIRWVAPVGAFLGLALLYAGTQLTITAVMGPDAKVQAYVAAIKSGNFEALKDSTLFPGSTETTPEEFRKAWTKSGTIDAHHQILSRDGLVASARVFNQADEENSYDIELSGSERWAFGFRVIDWSVTTPAPLTSLDVANRLHSGQSVTFGGDNNAVTVANLRKQWNGGQGERYSVIPGLYISRTSAAGFLPETSKNNLIWTSDATARILVDSDEPSLSGPLLAAAKKKVVAANRACAKTKCKGMPKYNAYDFNLWSQYTRSTYTNSVFSSTYSGGGCTGGAVQVLAFNKVSVDYSCDVVVKANLYVRYVYYYGYYSNYWWYWNFKDSKSTTTSPSVTFTANEAGTKITQGGVSW